MKRRPRVGVFRLWQARAAARRIVMPCAAETGTASCFHALVGNARIFEKKL
jgi:hypothetical protein